MLILSVCVSYAVYPHACGELWSTSEILGLSPLMRGNMNQWSDYSVHPHRDGEIFKAVPIIGLTPDTGNNINATLLIYCCQPKALAQRKMRGILHY